MGSREAQYALFNILGTIRDKDTLNIRLNIMEKLLNCASEQGLGEASKFLGISFKQDKKYQQSLKAFHQGVKNGNQQSAFRLIGAFLSEDEAKKRKDYLALKQDLERSKRYEIIDNYLFKYDFLQPKVPDLDDIVPLPPAKLPAWDGKIAFQRWYEGTPPTKPADELIRKLAQKAGLDWQTGILIPLKNN